MRDEIDSRLWVAHHQAFSDTVGAFLARLGEGFRRLQAIQYDAPWRHAEPPHA
jgi:hypothetical protein